MNINKFCLNCNKVGHISKKCNKPIKSYGIICFNNNLTNNTNYINSKCINKYININEYNYYNISNITVFNKYIDNIKFLMIMRKHSLSYIEFIRGKYDTLDVTGINKLFQLMSKDENIKIRSTQFDELWIELWMLTASSKLYRKEYIVAKDKFNKLKESLFYDLLNNDNLSKYIEPEWGFPKGRKNINECTRTCAMREFIEETNISDTTIFNRVQNIDETYIGTNNITYQNIYYLGYNANIISNHNFDTSFEIGDLKWFSLNECLEKFRPYEINKNELLLSVYFFLVNTMENKN